MMTFSVQLLDRDEPVIPMAHPNVGDWVFSELTSDRRIGVIEHTYAKFARVRLNTAAATKMVDMTKLVLRRIQQNGVAEWWLP